MPNYGLINNMADGIREGMTTYMTLQNQKRQQQQLGLLSGMQQDESGNWQYTPEKQAQIDAERQAQLVKNQQAQQENTPDSDQAKSIQEFYKQQGFKVPDHLTVSQMKGLIEPLATAREKNAGMADYRNQMLGLANKRIGLQEQKVGMQQDNQASQASDKLLKDKDLGNYTQRINGANRILGQLDDVASGKIVDTEQLLADTNTEYINLLTGANNPALGKLERTEYKTKASQLAGIIQQWTKDPTSIKSPEILKQLRTQIESMRDSYQNNYQSRLSLLKRDYKHNAQANEAQEKTASGLLSQYGPQQPQAPQHGKIKVTDGKTTLLIDPSDLEDAKKDGFKETK